MHNPIHFVWHIFIRANSTALLIIPSQLKHTIVVHSCSVHIILYMYVYTSVPQYFKLFAEWSRMIFIQGGLPLDCNFSTEFIEVHVQVCMYTLFYSYLCVYLDPQCSRLSLTIDSPSPSYKSVFNTLISQKDTCTMYI